VGGGTYKNPNGGEGRGSDLGDDASEYAIEFAQGRWIWSPGERVNTLQQRLPSRPEVEEDVGVAADDPVFEVKDELADRVFEAKMWTCGRRIVRIHMSQERFTEGDNVGRVDQPDDRV
jgi:hypothetical protein